MSKNQTEIYGNQDTRERLSSVLTLNCNSRARRTTGLAQIREIGEREKCDPPEQGEFPAPWKQRFSHEMLLSRTFFGGLRTNSNFVVRKSVDLATGVSEVHQLGVLR